MKTDLSHLVPVALSNAISIDFVDPAKLILDPKNPRTHNPRQMRALKASIQRFGFVEPVLVDEGGRVVGGSARVLVAKDLGYDEIPVIRISHLSEVDKRALRIALNRIAELAGWDREVLALELDGLVEIGVDTDALGFEAAEIDLLIDSVGEDPPVEAPLPAPMPATVRRGDLFVIGRHKLLCGDALDEASYQTLLGAERAHVGLCDSPYNLKASEIGGGGRIRHADFAMAAGEMDEAAYIGFLATIFRHMAAYSVNGSVHFQFIDWRHTFELLTAGRAAYDAVLNCCVWAKTAAGQGSFYRSQHESVWVFRKGDAQNRNNIQLGRFGRSRSNLWTYPGANAFGKDRLELLASHPTPKSVPLLADAILDVSQRGEIVLDPCAGSGSTAVAAEKTGRQARLIEIDPGYCSVILKRLQDYTGKAAIHLATGKSFDEIAERRLADGRATQAECGEPSGRST